MAREYPEVRVEVDGKPFTLAFDWAAIRFFEQESGISILKLIQQAQAAKRGGDPPMLSTLGLMMQAGLRRHHPDLDFEDCMDVFSSPGGQEALFKAFELAQPKAGGAVANNPPKGRRKK